ncbi:hypothetical protein HMPREF1624_00292 [Sporothrix schenckii ATCC 58251]|uniref:Zn(2)-C6 fungal-type domain-containing protein n=1 Tax=Sporothrix schenckii (strain ATCC 58251 / de Perez 2211183) TaxID=1391915 RepID=U7Q4B2_SPOS1|nr:hypothetical protein HMPREF1624_00292 [Sporothrix schenckii ATCC 58251]
MDSHPYDASVMMASGAPLMNGLLTSVPPGAPGTLSGPGGLTQPHHLPNQPPQQHQQHQQHQSLSQPLPVSQGHQMQSHPAQPLHSQPLQAQALQAPPPIQTQTLSAQPFQQQAFQSQQQPPPPPTSLASSGTTTNTTTLTLSAYDDGNANASNTSPSDTSQNTSQENRSPIGQPFTAVPTACLGCRSKHLKCDGQVPCSRCKMAEMECVYIASRRGYKGPRKSNKRMRSSSPPPGSLLGTSMASSAPDSCPMLLGAAPHTAAPQDLATVSAAFAQSTGIGPATSGYTTANAVGTLPPGTVTYSGTVAGTSASLSSTPAGSVSQQLSLYGNGYGANGNVVLTGGHLAPVAPIEDRCFDAFYHYFYGGHPFALPKDVMLSLARDSSSNIGHLIAAMRYIGSLYINAGPARAMFFDEAKQLIYLPSCPKDGFLVQAMIMLVVGLDGSCEQEQAREILSDVERIALDIGLHERGFAVANGRGNPIFEESWRRTWWDLFVVDGMVAGVHRVTNFALFDVPAQVALPCEEQQYLSGNIPTPLAYIEDFDDRLFSGEDREFSSFTYRIAAARILGRMMRCPPILFPMDENLEKIEAMLSNWRMHLPASKRDDLNKHCQLDEMMFQAHFITHACSIMLHQPHSQLDSSPTRSVTSCAPHSHVPSGDAFNTHTRHTITAACEISKMVTQAVPLLSHTHFFTCVITLSSIVHLSKWALYYIQDEEDLRDQIRLNIGALNKLSDVWKAANTASGQVKGVAQEIYRAKKAQQINPAFWVGFTQEEMINSLNTDEGIMSEFETLLPVATQ